MPDPQTVNRGYAIPLRGTDVGTWDVPLNGDFNLIDQNLGAVATIALTNSSVTLTPSQYACGTIRLTGTLSSDVDVFFPAVSGWWTVQNDTNPTSSLFVVRLALTGGTGTIGLPWGSPTDVYTDGSGVFFRKIGDVGTYYDWAGAAAPRWLSYCTKPPLLLCNGGTFSSGTYPVLAAILGTTTLPDGRGNFRATLNQGTSRITTAGSGVDGNTRFSVGGAQTVALTASDNGPHSHANSLNDPGHGHIVSGGLIGGTSHVFVGLNSGGTDAPNGPATISINTNTTGITISNSSSGSGTPHNNMPPTYIGGVTLIWAA